MQNKIWILSLDIFTNHSFNVKNQCRNQIYIYRYIDRCTNQVKAHIFLKFFKDVIFYSCLQNDGYKVNAEVLTCYEGGKKQGNSLLLI